MSRRPKVVFGMPAYNRPDTLARTLESLLGQTYENFAVVICDDAPTAAVTAIVEAYASLDSRIVYEANPVRLGMIENWRRTFTRGHALFPDSDYFAWVSDHDIWHPRWLEVLVPILDEHPEAVLAYPQSVRMYPTCRRRESVAIATEHVTRPGKRLRLATAMTAGNRIYGLFRARALAKAGVFRPVLMPDRQLLVELSLLGEFRQVSEMLWYREVSGAFSYARQRRMFFPGRSPVHIFMPVVAQHCCVLLWDLVVRGRGRPLIGRASGLIYSLMQLWYSTLGQLMHKDVMWRQWLRRTPRRGVTTSRDDQTGERQVRAS